MPRKKAEKPDPRYARSVLVRVPEGWHETLRQRAFEERRPVAELIREAMKAQLGLPCDCCEAP
jgi:hypothetical protein